MTGAIVECWGNQWEIWGGVMFSSWVCSSQRSQSWANHPRCVKTYCLLISLKFRCEQLWSWTSVFCFGDCKRGECSHIKEVLVRIYTLKVVRDSKASSILVPWTVRQDMGLMFPNFWTVQKQIVLSSIKANWFKFYQMLLSDSISPLLGKNYSSLKGVGKIKKCNVEIPHGPGEH